MRFNLGFADRFSENSFTMIEEKKSAPSTSGAAVLEPFVLDSEENVVKPSRFNQLKEMLFEKIVSVPCWFEYDAKTQYDLIMKFLASKNVKTPEVFAKILQHSILGFGVFDDYLLKKGVTSIFYEEGEPLLYTENDRNVVDTIILPYSKVRLAVQNIINMSQYSDKNGIYDFRIADFWVQLRAVPHSRIKLSISKITDEFLANEIDKNNLTLLLSDM